MPENVDKTENMNMAKNSIVQSPHQAKFKTPLGPQSGPSTMIKRGCVDGTRLPPAKRRPGQRQPLGQLDSNVVTNGSEYKYYPSQYTPRSLNCALRLMDLSRANPKSSLCTNTEISSVSIENLDDGSRLPSLPFDVPSRAGSHYNVQPNMDSDSESQTILNMPMVATTSEAESPVAEFVSFIPNSEPNYTHSPEEEAVLSKSAHTIEVLREPLPTQIISTQVKTQYFRPKPCIKINGSIDSTKHFINTRLLCSADCQDVQLPQPKAQIDGGIVHLSSRKCVDADTVTFPDMAVFADSIDAKEYLSEIRVRLRFDLMHLDRPGEILASGVTKTAMTLFHSYRQMNRDQYTTYKNASLRNQAIYNRRR
eukprot:CFRG4452T1